MPAQVVRTFRIAWAVLSWVIVQNIVFAAALLPATSSLIWLQERVAPMSLRIVIISLALVPAYLSFALALLVLSPIASRVVGWRTPPDAEMPIRDLGWDLLRWARYAAATHLVRLVAGSVLRASPAWTFYMRLNGARAGRGVYVNSLAVTDHNLLEIGEGTVIGAEVHLSGHTVEGGVVRTGHVRIGRNVTLGIGSIVGIDVEIGDDTQVGALSLVPKHERLAPRAVYFGIPVQRIDQLPHQRSSA